jgi:hypothetical protein
MVLPLPLTPFEDYMLADDRPQWPMAFFLRLELRGEYSRPVLERAVQAALARHPLLCSLLADDGRGRLQWVEGPGSLPPIQCCESADAIDLQAGRQIDLRREIGLRLWVSPTAATEWTLWLQFHHACCDGLGAMRFIGDLLAAYHSQLSGTMATNQPVLDPGRLRQRGSFGLTFLRRLLRIPQELLGLLGAVEFFSHRPPGLITPADEGDAQRDSEPTIAEAGKADPQAFPRWLTHRFSTEQSQRLHAAARARGVTLNDLLLARLFSALDDWFAAHRPAARQQFLRVMVPTNLRTAADRQTPAANIVSLVNLDRRPARYADHRRLLKSLSWEMAIIKRCRLGITMHHLAWLARRFGKFRWLVRDDRCLCTCVLSNLGDASGAGEFASGGSSSAESGLELVSLDFLPPIRPWTAAAFGVLSYRGRLAVTLHLDPRMPPGSDRELLAGFVGRLHEQCDHQQPLATSQKPTAIEV